MKADRAELTTRLSKVHIRITSNNCGAFLEFSKIQKLDSQLWQYYEIVGGLNSLGDETTEIAVV